MIVLSMGTTNQLYSPHIINIAMRFKFNTIFYVQYRSEEISPSTFWSYLKPKFYQTFSLTIVRLQKLICPCIPFIIHRLVLFENQNLAKCLSKSSDLKTELSELPHRGAHLSQTVGGFVHSVTNVCQYKTQFMFVG